MAGSTTGTGLRSDPNWFSARIRAVIREFACRAVLDGMPVGRQYALSGYIGGFTSHVMGGDFLKGAISAITVRAFNDLLHQNPRKWRNKADASNGTGVIDEIKRVNSEEGNGIVRAQDVFTNVNEVTTGSIDAGVVGSWFDIETEDGPIRIRYLSWSMRPADREIYSDPHRTNTADGKIYIYSFYSTTGGTNIGALTISIDYYNVSKFEKHIGIKK